MFGLGITEIVVILVVALLFIGPEKLPEVAKSLGRGLREFRKVTDDVRDSVTGTVNDAVRNVAAKPPAPTPAPAAQTPVAAAVGEPPSPIPGTGMASLDPASPHYNPILAPRPPEDGERVKANAPLVEAPAKDPVT